jgi:hypothetical protein
MGRRKMPAPRGKVVSLLFIFINNTGYQRTRAAKDQALN